LSQTAFENGRIGASPYKKLLNRDETYLSAQQSAQKTDARVSRQDGLTRWTPSAQAAAQQGPSPPDGIDSAQTARLEPLADARFGSEHRLRRRADFLRTRRLGIRFQTEHFVIYLAKLPDQETARLGLAVSRQIGNAVARNRTKRRLRESFRCTLRSELGTYSALVVVARKGAAELKTQEVTAELKSPLSRMAAKLKIAPGPQS
jgi:ribonuclease P protein component